MRGAWWGELRVAGSRRRYGQGTFWGDQIGPNPTDRGKNGVKRSLLVEADGGPLAVVIAGANVPDFKLLLATLDAIVVERPQPSESAPQNLCLDKGYESEPPENSRKNAITSHTSGASAKRSSMRWARNVIRRGVGWWSARWAGFRSAGRFWCVTRKKPPTIWG